MFEREDLVDGGADDAMPVVEDDPEDFGRSKCLCIANKLYAAFEMH